MNKHITLICLLWAISSVLALPDTEISGSWSTFRNFGTPTNNAKTCLPQPPMPPVSGFEDLCPFVNAGLDQTVCNGNCITLTADYAEIFSPSDYNIQNVAYAPASYNAPNAVNVTLELDDIWSGVVNIPFDFCFYGNTYNQMVIGSNGIISFNTSYANNYCVWPITNGLPSATMNDFPFTNVICSPFHDINPSMNYTPERIHYHVEDSAPCRRMVITWKDVPMGTCNEQLATQQIILYEASNVIETHIQNKPLCASWNGGKAIHGIQNSTGTSAAIIPGRNNPTQWTTSNEGIRFVPNGSPILDITWLENGTTVSNGASIDVCPTATTTYTCQVVYTRCNGTTATYTDDVTVNIDNNPTIGISQSGSTCANGVGIYAVTNPGVSGTQYNWVVTGGTITAGQGTANITVQWGNGGAGTVHVDQTNP